MWERKNVIDVDVASSFVFMVVTPIFVCRDLGRLKHNITWLVSLRNCFWKKNIVKKSSDTNKLLENLPLPGIV